MSVHFSSSSTVIRPTDSRLPTIIQQVFQYSLRMSLFVKSRQKRKSSALAQRILGVISFLSAIRRLLSLFDLTQILYTTLVDWTTPTLSNPLTKSPKLKFPTIEIALNAIRETLDTVATIGDAIYLVGNIGLLPVQRRKLERIDLATDYSTLLASSIGLYSVSEAVNQIWEEGRARRKKMVALESRIETDELFQDPDTLPDDDRRLRERVRAERRKLRGLRDELNGLWVERIRLIFEASSAVISLNTYKAFGYQESVRAVSGLASAVISLSQSWQEFVRD